jgi:serine/threonine-protein kinase
MIVGGKFRIERLLEVGGMGRVVEATHLALDERVALKFVRQGGDSGDPAVLAQLTREARAAVKLKSEHVARVIDVAVEPALGPYIIMEYLEGRDLRTILDEEVRVPFAEAVELVIQVCEALAEAHLRGIVHRDIKPENLFLTERDDGWRTVKVLDFGISKLRGPVVDHDGGTDPCAPRGTPAYMAPEQLRAHEDTDRRADLWSLGAVLFELVCGAPPFGSGSLASIVVSVLEGSPPPLHELVPEAPRGLGEVVERCLRKDPAQRFQNAGDLAIALLPFAPRRAHVPAERAIAATRAAGLPIERRSASDADTLAPPPLSTPLPLVTIRESGGPGAGRFSSAGVSLPARDIAPEAHQATAPRHPRRAGAALAIVAALAAAIVVGGRIDDDPEQPIHVIVSSGPGDSPIAPARGRAGVTRASSGLRAAVHGRRAPRLPPAATETATAAPAEARAPSVEVRPKGDLEPRPRAGDGPRPSAAATATATATRAMPSDIILRR